MIKEITNEVIDKLRKGNALLYKDDEIVSKIYIDVYAEFCEDEINKYSLIEKNWCFSTRYIFEKRLNECLKNGTLEWEK